MIANRFQQALDDGTPHSMTLTYTDGRTITVDSTEDVLAALDAISKGAAQNAPTPELIVQAVCVYFDVAVADLQSDNRRRSYVIPRHIACYLCRELCDTRYTLLQMSKAIYGSERGAHHQVIHGWKQTSNLLETDKRYPTFIRDIRHTILQLLQTQP